MPLNFNRISPLPYSAQEFIYNLSCNKKVSRLIVFGSRACGDYEKYSDIDLAIEALPFKKQDWLYVREQAYYEVRTVLQISIVDFARNPERLRNKILENGVVVYEQ